MRLCYECSGGKRTADEPSCYRPDDMCKWDAGEVCVPRKVGEYCICEAVIVTCKVCDGRGVILSPLEQLADQA